ncbi:MAG: pimeloyl-ACP methyl ester esterase BioH [Proteobacteria bacterium]|nr:pimeloyl-ACP methyl ester esterase BioH [Pseudomonadota bacterium]
MTLHVETVGAGPPLVLLHGWGLHAGFFAPALGRLARASCVMAVDLPGHGASPPLSPYTLDAIVEALDATLAAVDEPVTLLGWSFGGLVALRYAARMPARVARLVLACTTPRFTRAPDWPQGVDAEVVRRFGDELTLAYDATVKRFLTLQMMGAPEPRPTLAAMRAQLAIRRAPDPVALRGALDILLATDIRAQVPGLTQPALVVTGGRDALTPPAAGAWLAATLPHATLCAIEDAAHVPFLSHPAAFDAALTAFLAAHADGR